MCIIVIFTALSRATAIPGIEKYRGPGCSVITQMLHSYNIKSYTWRRNLLWCILLWVTVKCISCLKPHNLVLRLKYQISPKCVIYNVSMIQRTEQVALDFWKGQNSLDTRCITSVSNRCLIVKISTLWKRRVYWCLMGLTSQSKLLRIYGEEKPRVYWPSQNPNFRRLWTKLYFCYTYDIYDLPGSCRYTYWFWVLRSKSEVLKKEVSKWKQKCADIYSNIQSIIYPPSPKVLYKIQ